MLKFSLIITIAITIISCSNSNEPEVINHQNQYLPLEIGNTWTYSNNSELKQVKVVSSQEVTVNNSTAILYNLQTESTNVGDRYILFQNEVYTVKLGNRDVTEFTDSQLIKFLPEKITEKTDYYIEDRLYFTLEPTEILINGKMQKGIVRYYSEDNYTNYSYYAVGIGYVYDKFVLENGTSYVTDTLITYQLK